MTFLNKVIAFFKKRKKIHISVDPESVKKNHMIKAQQNVIAELHGKLAKFQVEEGKRRERDRDLDEEEEIKLVLNKQKKQIEEKRSPIYFSLRTFFNKIKSDKKFRNKLGFYSWDKSTKLGKFGDFGFAGDGSIVLLDEKGEVLLKARNIKDIFWSLPGLGNEVKSGMIPICVNKEGDYIENIMVQELAELIPDGGGKFQYSASKKKPVYDLMLELSQDNIDLREDFEQSQITATKLKRENDALKVSERVATDSAATTSTELSKVEKSTSSISKNYRSLATELAKVRETNTVYEGNIEKLQNQFEKMRDEAEGKGTQLQFDKALEMLLNIKRDIVRDEPDRIIERVIEKEAKPPQLPPK